MAALVEDRDVARADVVGSSLGEDIGLRSAMRHPDPVRTLVVVSGNSRSEPGPLPFPATTRAA